MSREIIDRWIWNYRLQQKKGYEEIGLMFYWKTPCVMLHQGQESKLVGSWKPTWKNLGAVAVMNTHLITS